MPNSSTFNFSFKIPNRGVHFLLAEGIPSGKIKKKFEKGIKTMKNVSQILESFTIEGKMIIASSTGMIHQFNNYKCSRMKDPNNLLDFINRKSSLVVKLIWRAGT